MDEQWHCRPRGKISMQPGADIYNTTLLLVTFNLAFDLSPNRVGLRNVLTTNMGSNGSTYQPHVDAEEQRQVNNPKADLSAEEDQGKDQSSLCPLPFRSPVSSVPYIPRTFVPTSPPYIPSSPLPLGRGEFGRNDAFTQSSTSVNLNRGSQFQNHTSESDTVSSGPKIDCGTSVVDFVRVVWGFRAVDLDAASNSYSLSSSACRAYNSSLDDDPAVNGPREAFSEIFSDLMRQLVTPQESTFGELAKRLGCVFHISKRNIYLEDPVTTKIDMARLMQKSARSILGPLSLNQGISLGGKRKREDEENMPLAKRIRMTVIPQEELSEASLQMIHHLRALFSSGIRVYVTGVLVEERMMSLWYADRMGIVQSAHFSFMEEPHLFLLAIAALVTANAKKLGLCPLIKFPCSQAETFDFRNNNTAILKLPHAFDAQNKKMRLLEFQLDTSGDRTIFNASEIDGRGTAVVPVKAKNWEAKNWFGDEELVAKMAWTDNDHCREDNCLRVVRSRMSQHSEGRKYLKNVSDLKCSFDMKMSDREMGLPRALMDDLADFQYRIFRVFILKSYIPLQRVKSPEEFKDIFTQVVTAHYWVFEVSGIIHRDISANNIMFYREADGRAVGVLCDWDLAEDFYKLADEYQVEEYKSIVGTPPFIAIDLLRKGQPPPHEYRHDLESFFFVMVWFCAEFDPEGAVYNGHLRSWNTYTKHNTLVELGTLKKAFLEDDDAYDTVFARTHTSYRPLVSPGEWVDNLRRLFLSLEKKYEEVQGSMLKSAVLNVDTEEYRLKKHRALVAERRDEIVSYKTFMRCLGVEAETINDLEEGDA